MIPSPYCTIGPYFPNEFADAWSDLTRHDGKEARGERIVLTGRVLEEGGIPTINTILEIWQPDTNGIFRSELDPRRAEADPGFFGWGRARTDKDGRYRFTTILPGGIGRAPHANLMILAIGLTRRLTTTVFFSDAPDPVLNCVPPEARKRLIAVREADGVYRFDIVLRGENETPFFLD